MRGIPNTRYSRADRTQNWPITTTVFREKIGRVGEWGQRNVFCLLIGPRFLRWIHEGPDESGDDLLQLERTIQLCGDEGVVVHVVGPSAVMGCQKGSQLCRLKKNNTSYSFWLTVN